MIDLPALRKAAGNPQSAQALHLPALKSLERLPSPKQTLHELLLDASATTGRRRRNFDVDAAKFRLADLIGDYAVLRALPAFRSLEADVINALSV